jgi:hypothetical protein
LKLGPRITVWRAEDINRLIEAGIPSATDARPTLQGCRARPEAGGGMSIPTFSNSSGI